MSRHPGSCQSVPPTTPTVNGVYHRHYCIHDATLPFGTVLEHECRCGMTWTEPEFEITFRPDVTAAEIEEFTRVRQRGDMPRPHVVQPDQPGDPWGIWPIVIVLAVVAAIVYAAVEVWR